MKKLISLVFVICLLSCSDNDINSVIIEPTLEPDKIYTVKVITENNLITEYGNEEIIKVVKSKGVDYPITSFSKITIESTTSTGHINKDGGYNLKASFDQVSEILSGSKTNLKKTKKSIKGFEGAVVYGQIDKDNSRTIDSIKGLNDMSLKAVVEQSMKSIVNQPNYPKERIGIGQSFTQETPINVPTQTGEMLEMIIQNKYTLDSINANIAYFTIDQETVAKTTIVDSELKITSSGEGVCEYDILNKNNRLLYTNSEMNTDFNIKGIRIIITSNTKSTTISGVKENDTNTH